MKKFVRNGILIIASATVCSTVSNTASAGTATATMTNTVTIANLCVISTLGFTTTYDPVVANASTPQTATASVTTTCTIGASPVITLDAGAHANTGSTSAVPLRRLANTGATAFLNYGLFSDSGHTVTWGGTAGTAPAPVTATGLPTLITIYASIPAAQSEAAATYTDSVIATVTF
ncbi:Spore coat protein U (SCPU) domain-containing protein [Collimonas sp. OK307]|uniref:spore coat U domain-containing protein n=1 Tax=Collimonas sp. OK307 TaxID=1801620 RepID=UPI0008E3BBC5|nr:spore coat U domain-containing protein [Collimonas sp. OK307]SFH64801.1 Spore coat protein U (SCPU) domain-containing protein [Collimonas sp. OK307]